MVRLPVSPIEGKFAPGGDLDRLVDRNIVWCAFRAIIASDGIRLKDIRYENCWKP